MSVCKNIKTRSHLISAQQKIWRPKVSLFLFPALPRHYMMSMLTSLTLVSHYDLTLFFIAFIQCGHGKNFSGIHVVDVGLGLWRWTHNGYYILNGSSQCQLHQNALVKMMLSLFIPTLWRDKRFRNVLFWSISPLKYSEKIHWNEY